MSRTLLTAAVALTTLGLAACDGQVRTSKTEVSVSSGKPVRTIAKLECPQTEGDLTLVKAAPDGQSCDYAGKDSDVKLKLLPIADGDTAAVLSPIETELRGLMPARPATAKVEADDKGRANVDLPGIHIKADKDGSAKVDIAGIVKVDADGDDRAEVRVNDAGQDAKTDSVTAFFVLTDKAGPSYKAVGYQARGPKKGPIAVAVVRVKSQAGRDDGAFHAAKELIRLNVGG